jgi:hypothetical protein
MKKFFILLIVILMPCTIIFGQPMPVIDATLATLIGRMNLQKISAGKCGWSLVLLL